MLHCFNGFGLENFPFIDHKFDALTDYQKLCKIFEYFETKINTVDKKYQNYGEEVERLNAEFIALQTRINDTLNRFETKINAQIEEILNNYKNEILHLLEQYQVIFRNYVDNEINVVNERINNIEVGAVNIYNPLNGNIEPVGTVVNDLYNALRYNAISVEEFEALMLTATGFDTIQITAQNFDLNGKSILV